MHPLKSERAAVTGGRWAMRPWPPQRAPKGQILTLPVNLHACSSLERERIPQFDRFQGQKGETSSLTPECDGRDAGDKRPSEQLLSPWLLVEIADVQWAEVVIIGVIVAGQTG